jgi:hypothetical protein
MQQLWDSTVENTVSKASGGRILGSAVLQSWKLLWGGFVVSLYALFGIPSNLRITDPLARQWELQFHQVLYVPLCLVTLWLVMKIYRAQMQKAACATSGYAT